ncbi:threonine--tRNA ligase [Streptomyces rimosus subsp. rimosus ATCC 10970]|uniref:Threonine--tRNA ligase n=2 Tax=Streptomyces rimosus subsp. rimosus TaxID=132474 RepID=A0A8A1V3T8_STRR1|nr:threonine--tRNA ligase [Streptomyces rimosus]MYT48120.1 threonine--tRNA ligase [Streptomyces sp. SID5471]QDA08911.1 threonine--tRNA ligase [Streptomyces rimosus]QEV80190.1 threonine--tRNA ligase [Streptomyces rimosus]QST85602.1 threonine--tRNA ligase [Streptomyces rimosus subsp. rimosus ATCC 10970]QTL91056.1 threonine--tRNA ligase [Streptomyces rimosus subsp. rimosus]
MIQQKPRGECPGASPSGHSPAAREETTMYDHRRLGRELGLFGSDPLIGSGLPYWLPDGATVRHTLEEYVRDAERRAGYQHVYSPVLGKRELYELSGHWSHYNEDMFPPMDLGGEQVVLRPSLCPHHAVIYRSRAHSYRELPLRMAELGGMYRAELSGVLGGLSRVRAIQLNDAHIFCTLDQAADEAQAALGMIRRAYEALGIRPSRYRLSLPGPGGKYVAAPEMWERSTTLLAEVLDRSGLPYEEGEGEAAFYGPKIDVQVADSAGRESTLSTVQIDFHQPERFDLHYIGPDGARHRPVMVHRSVIGSVERAVAHLIEEHGGAFPAWFAPTQLVILPISDSEVAAAEAVAERCARLGLRARLAGPERGSLGARIREDRRVPYQAVIGAKEAADGHVALRLRDGRRLDPRPADAALRRIGALVGAHRTELWECGEVGIW